MKFLDEILVKYKMVLMYLVFGVLTTVINFLVYFVLYKRANIPNVPSNVIAWILAVAFAFVTNKLYVFESRKTDFATIVREGLTFVSARILTGLMDIAIMYFVVDVQGWNATIWKLVSNAIVITCNYVASKLVIFKNRDKTADSREQEHL